VPLHRQPGKCGSAAAARAGIQSVVFVPRNLERPKILASAVYDTTLIAIEGTYDDVNKLASEIAAEEEGWAFVNVNVRPYYAEGSKTLATRSPSSLAGACRTRSSFRSPPDRS
jgi:threonine synthase